MIQKILFRLYLLISTILFAWILFAWITVTYGDAFANIAEATQAILKLLIVAVPPILLLFYRNSQNKRILISIVILLIIESLQLSYQLVGKLDNLNVGTAIIELSLFLLIIQIITGIKKWQNFFTE